MPRARALREAAAGDGAAARRLSLDQLLRLNGEASGPVLLMLLALLSSLPVAGAGTLFSLGLWALAWAWLCGRENIKLPQRLAGFSLNATWTRRALNTLAWIHEQAERWLRPRWTAGCHARTRAGWGLWIALMAAIIFLPLPLGNLLPSLSLVLLSLGWMFRDGCALLLSGAVGVGAVAYTLYFGHLAVEVLGRVVGWLPLA